MPQDFYRRVGSGLSDPYTLSKFLWPEVRLYREQREVMESVELDGETFVVAGNMLGKDFVAGVITTSVDGTQLEAVLWGEIRRFVGSSRVPLTQEKGGPLVVNHLHVRKLYQEKVCGLSYIVGRVATKGEGMLGHHIAKTGDGVPRTLFVADEASGVEDTSYERADTWADRKLIIGNAYPCSNFFKRGVKGGSLRAPQLKGVA